MKLSSMIGAINNVPAFIRRTSSFNLANFGPAKAVETDRSNPNNKDKLTLKKADEDFGFMLQFTELQAFGKGLFPQSIRQDPTGIGHLDSRNRFEDMAFFQFA